MGRAMFGRQTELALVSRLLDAISSGPAALILGGEAGIGKSTLWLEALSQARTRPLLPRALVSAQRIRSEAVIRSPGGPLRRGRGRESRETSSPPAIGS
jgi:hypothetical protein